MSVNLIWETTDGDEYSAKVGDGYYVILPSFSRYVVEFNSLTGKNIWSVDKTFPTLDEAKDKCLNHYIKTLKL